MDTLHLTALPIVIWILATPCDAVDCLYAQQKCIQNRTCAIMLTMVPQLCGNSSSETTCQQAPEPSQCDSILEILTQSKVFEGCQCDPFQSYFAQCDEVYRMVFRQQCTVARDQTSIDLPTEAKQTRQDYIPLYTWPFLTATDHEEVPPTGGSQNGESTCVQALASCTGDVTCRKLLAEYISQCSKDRISNTCRTTQCRNSIRFFLDHVSPVYTHALLYCYCTSADSQCELLRRGLNADCANKGSIIPNCLELSDQCYGSTLCSTNFENYKKHCAISDTSGTGCARSYGECRNARLGILGTVVAATCTCVGSEGPVATRCKQQQHIVSDNSCFLRASYAYYSPADNVEDVRTTQMSRLRINKRVHTNKGCDVKLGSGSHDIYVRAGNAIRIPDEHIADCTQICRCLSSGFLSECFSVLCNVTTLCRNDTSSGSDTHKECVWSGCQRICIDTQLTLTSRHPGLLLAYSVTESELIRHQLHVKFNISVITEKLHQLLASINTRNQCQLECMSDAGNKNGTIVCFAHSKHRQEWECMNQLLDLASLINTRAPSVATDVILSMVKIASVVEAGLSPKTTHSRSCGVWYHQHSICYLFYLFVFLTLIRWASENSI